MILIYQSQMFATEHGTLSAAQTIVVQMAHAREQWEKAGKPRSGDRA